MIETLSPLEQQLLSKNVKQAMSSKRQVPLGSPTDRDSKKQRTGEDGRAITMSNLLQASLAQAPQDSSPALNPNFLMNEQYIRAELNARRYQQEMAANQNMSFMASLLGQSQGQNFAAFQQQQQQQQQQALLDSALQGQLSSGIGGNPNMDNFLLGLMNRGQTHQQGLSTTSLAHQLQQPQSNMFAQGNVDVNAVLRQLTWPAQGMDLSQGLERMARASAGVTPQGNHGGMGSIRLPPCDEGLVRPFTEREKFPLGVDEDPNWLSEFHCFVRSELVEICRASHDDCKSRNNATSYQQVGIRCRFCAHRPPTGRGCRSSAYPSSIRQIYQSFTMMLRDHFGNCESIPDDIKKRFLSLKDKPSQGATDSKRYWIYSAMKAGLADSSDGIIINHNTVLAGMSAPPFGNETPGSWQKEAAIASPLVTPADGNLGSPVLRCLLTHAQVVQLRESERIGNRRSLEQGLPGFSCRCCWEKRRLGLCRMFPARRRTLAQKLTDLHDHLRRCQATPDSVKEEIERLHRDAKEENIVDSGDTKALLDRVWARLGHGGN